MSGPDAVFALLAIGGGLSAVMTVTSRNLVHAALFLAATLASIGGVFLVLQADFLALVQVLVYVGAVAVLFLFGLMLTRAPVGREALDSQNRALGFGVALTMFGVLAALIVQAFQDAASNVPASTSIGGIGEAIFSSWVLPFELASMLLLAALIGAVVLARRDEGDSGQHEESPELEMSETPSSEGGVPAPEEPPAVGAGTGDGGGGRS